MSTADLAHPLPRVAVVGSGARARPGLAVPLGRLIAGAGWHLVTGGGAGVMAEVARAFVETRGRRGLSIGILPADPGADPPGPPPGYPNPWVELPVVTHLAERGEEGASPASRNHIVVLSGSAVVALPGGAGTASEVLLALRYGRPVLGFGRGRESSRGEGPDGIPVADTFDEVEAWLRARLE